MNISGIHLTMKLILHVFLPILITPMARLLLYLLLATLPIICWPSNQVNLGLLRQWMARKELRLVLKKG